MMKMNLIILITIMLASCGEHFPWGGNNPDNKKYKMFELVWETLMNKKSLDGVIPSDYVQVWKNYFITTGDTKQPAIIRAFNKKTGKKEWEYVHSGKLKYDIIYNSIKEDVYIGITGDGVFGFDLNQRKIKWEINLHSMDIRFGWGMTIHGDYIYMPVTWMFGKVNIADERIIRIDYRAGEMETVYHIKSVDSLMDAFSAPVFWTDSDTGHDIMYFNNQNWNYYLSPQEISQDMIAVDIETGEVLWCNYEFTPVASNGSIHPIIYKDNVITGGDWSIYSFDARTGEQNWKTEFPQPQPWSLWSTTEHLIKENRLYVNEVGDDIVCLNADNGKIIWHNKEDAPNCTPTMTYYQDMLVYTSWGKGSIMVLDAFTGERIHRERSHNGSTFNTDVVYDKETDMFFTTDYKYAYGFKIHKPE